MGWGKNLYELVRIPIKKVCNIYYLRWYYNGWHYWAFLPGKYTIVTEGEKYRTIGTRKIAMGTGQITRSQCNAIRTILNTREVYLLTIAGWMNIRVEPGTVNIYDNRLEGNEIEIIAVIGSKEITYSSGFSPVGIVPIITPSAFSSYCEIVIGNQVWMCKNWDSNYPGSKVYNDDETNRVIYGGLYNFSQVKNPGFCPAGYHVPNVIEWTELINFLGGNAVAGGKLKQVGLGLGYWLPPNTGAADTYGFTAKGSGYYGSVYNHLDFYSLHSKTKFLTATPDGTRYCYIAELNYNSAAIALNSIMGNEYCSLRLIKDSPAPPLVITTILNGLFSISFDGTDIIVIDWGDGVVESVDLTGGAVNKTHSFTGSGTIIITNQSCLTVISSNNCKITSITGMASCNNIYTINLSDNELTNFDTYLTWPDLYELFLHGNHLTSINTFAEWAAIHDLDVSENLLTSFTTHPWPTLWYLLLYNNQLTAITTYATWINLNQLILYNNLLDSIVTHPEWVALSILYLYDNLFTTIQTHVEWVNIFEIRCNDNPLTTFVVFSEWLLLYRLYLQNCAISVDTDINNMLIEIESTYDTMMYIRMQGGTNAAPTGAGLVAKASLIALGASVTTN